MNPFSPNPNDNIFYTYGIGIEDFEINIYNRWGERVFVSLDTKVGWDGTYDGKKVTEDVYVYVAKARSVNGKSITKTGTVTVLR